MQNENNLIDLDEGIIGNWVLNKTASMILKKIAGGAKKDFGLFMQYAKSAGFEDLLLKTIRQFFRIKASKLELIANYAVPNIKVESADEIDEGLLDSITEPFERITKYFNLYRVYRKIKEMDKKDSFIENNKKIVISSLIWLLVINGDLIKYVQKFKDVFLSN